MTSANNLLGTFEQVVLLAVLRIGDGAYPPLVRKELEEGLGRHVSRGSVYVTLDRLERKGLSMSQLGDSLPEPGGRARRFYALTEEGEAALAESRAIREAMWRRLGEAR